MFRLFHQENSAGALDLTGDFAVKVSCQSSETARKNLATLGSEFLEEVRILEVNSIDGDVETTTRHHAVGAAEIGAALWCLGNTHGSISLRVLRNGLFGLAVEGVSAKIRVVLLLLKTAWGIEAFLVAGRCVAGYRLSFGNRFGAFNGNDVAWHKNDG